MRPLRGVASGPFSTSGIAVSLHRKQCIWRCVCVPLVVCWTLGYVALTLINVPMAPLTEVASRERVTLTTAMEAYVDKEAICDRLARHVINESQFNQSVLDACQQWTLAQNDYFRARPYRVNTFRRRLLRPGSSICTDSTFMVVVVHSLHTYGERRAAIRETWGGAAVSGNWPGITTQLPEVRVAFIFGCLPSVRGAEDRLAFESDQYGDIVQGNFNDSYRNMTLKSLTGLDWVIDYCPSAKVMFKCDDDMFVNIPAILDAVQTTDMRGAIMGPYNAGSRVYRKGKWAILPADYPFYYYPPYESGSGYAISADLLQSLRNASDYVPYIFIDDVYITGILGRVIGVRHVTRPGFAFWTNRAPSACAIRNGSVLTGTRVDPKRQREIWSDLCNPISCIANQSTS